MHAQDGFGRGLGAMMNDAVIVLPGTMGSELVEVSTGRTLWGPADASWYAGAWTTGGALDALAVTNAERSGRVGRIRATRLLHTPAWAPLLGGFEPYTELVRALRRAAADPAAVHEFPYDWRLPVDYNAGLLAIAAYEHLRRWRRHPLGGRDARLVLVAHSTGGLVARYFTEVLGDAAELRALVTLGSPFLGAAKALHVLGGAPTDPGSRSASRPSAARLPEARLRRFAATAPGLYDLLPSYRCLDEGSAVRRPTTADVAAVGGDERLAEDAFARRERLLGTGSWDTLWPVVGVGQPTVQSLVIRDGVVRPRFTTCTSDGNGGIVRADRRGDDTVCRRVAAPAALKPFAVVQTHGALARSREAIGYVCAVLRQEDPAPERAGDVVPLALDVADSVAAGGTLDIVVDGVADPTAIGVRVVDVATGVALPQALPVARDGRVTIRQILPVEGLFRVLARTGEQSPVSRLVLATDPSAAFDPTDPG
ncbi:esterase/lipase family protein [Embleya sp. NPDC056575]|uniref:esterase/lipase family protein n=1 Tax=unclassified Embleya TaxID=2699296 RepID=UPI0036A6BDC9